MLLTSVYSHTLYYKHVKQSTSTVWTTLKNPKITMSLLIKIICSTLGGYILISNLGYSTKESMIYSFFISIALTLLSEISDKLTYIIKNIIK